MHRGITGTDPFDPVDLRPNTALQRGDGDFEVIEIDALRAGPAPEQLDSSLGIARAGPCACAPCVKSKSPGQALLTGRSR